MNVSDFNPANFAEAPRNMVRDAWDLLGRVPGGKRLYAAFVGRAAAYTGSIDPRVEEISPGRCVASMRDRPAVRNHLSCVHAIALANLAELTGNTALAYSLPDDARFIVAGMTMEYLKKARGTIRAISECPVPETSERKEYLVPVSLRNAAGEEVARATLRTLVGPKKAR